jgi:hypothetical protein
MARMNYNRPQFRTNLGGQAYVTHKKFKPIPEDHKDHCLISIAVPKPHYGKLVCATCNNKFVKFVGPEEFRRYNKKQ